MIRDTIPRFFRRLTDKIFEGTNRTRIVLGTDRKDDIHSGYGDGGRNDVSAGAIDIVAGYIDQNTSFAEDKSRVYLSGKANPDEYLDIDQGKPAVGEACIILKSENDYIVAENNIKIVCGSNVIIINKNGDIQIEGTASINIKAGAGVLNISSSGEISLGVANGIPKRILTENDICVGTSPPGGGIVVSNFLAPGALITNQNVKVK